MKTLESYFAPDGPGAALAVATDDETLIECRGLSNLEEGSRITPETRFELASASKWFTAAAVVLLAERGELTLTDPLSAYFPGLESGEGRRPINLRDLLWHTSGLVEYLGTGVQSDPSEMTKSHVLAKLPEWVSDSAPGREFRYSNTNYVVLARVVEAVAGVSFPEFIAMNLVQPFGLRSTAVMVQEDPARPIARGYRNVGWGVPSFEPIPNPPIDTDGDGGVVSCLDDMLRWTSHFWAGRIVNQASLQLMRTPGVLDSGKTTSYGMGLMVDGAGRPVDWYGHGGSWTNATTLVGRYLSRKTSVIVLSNEWLAPVERISQRAFALAARDRRRPNRHPGD